jgi:hypothetical protein
MEQSVTNGVDWSPLWGFRREHYNKKWLKEAKRFEDRHEINWLEWDPDLSEQRYGLDELGKKENDMSSFFD